MRVRMLVDVQGFGVRSDGTIFDWPGRGREIDLDDNTAVDMVRNQQAVPVSTFNAEDDSPETLTEEQRGMVTAAQVFTRPTNPPEIKLPESADPTSESEVPAAVEPFVDPIPEPESELVKRGPGRPRKNSGGNQ